MEMQDGWMKLKVELKKRKEHVKSTQTKIPQQVKDRRKRELMECKKVKRVIKENKRQVDESFDCKLNETENKSLNWKQILKREPQQDRTAEETKRKMIKK